MRIFVTFIVLMITASSILAKPFFTIEATDEDGKSMLKSIGFDSFESMVVSTVPANILAKKELKEDKLKEDWMTLLEFNE